MPVDTLSAYLAREGLAEGPVLVERIGEGQSNLTYALLGATAPLVLRRGPRPPYPPSAHDMLREARVLRAVGSTGYPVPRVRATCDDLSVIGVPFYVMDRVDGDVVTATLPARFESADERRAFVLAAVDALADLHALPLVGPLATIGRPDGYLARQVERFSALAQSDPVRELADVVAVASWLGSRVPASPRASVVHGDFRLGNVMFADGLPPRVGAVMDWEMATAGDPLADLGYFTATYADRDSTPTVMELTSVTRAPGFPTREDVVARYADRTGADTSALAWYQVLALWKSAVFCEAIYVRWIRGERPDDTTFAPFLEQGVPELLAAARRIIETARLPR